mgnify:CR=1 FL=1
MGDQSRSSLKRLNLFAFIAKPQETVEPLALELADQRLGLVAAGDGTDNQAIGRTPARGVRLVRGEQLAAFGDDQLTRLEQTSPLYWYRYGEGLRNSLQMLYPDSLAVKALDKQWQAQLGSQQGDVISVPTYLDARAGVDALLARGRQEYNVAKRKEIYAKVQELIMDAAEAAMAEAA